MPKIVAFIHALVITFRRHLLLRHAPLAVRRQSLPLLFKYVFALILPLNFACVREQSTLSQNANFDFVLETDSQLQGWKKVHRTIMDIEADSSEAPDGKPSLKIGTREFVGRSWPLIANLQQRVLIPRVAADSAKISFTGKSRDLEAAELIVSAIDRNEDLLYSRALSCLSNGKWQTSSMTVPLKDVLFLHLELKASSADTNATWWLNKIRISADGKDIGELARFAGHEKFSLAEMGIVPLSFDGKESYAAIPELSSKKLLALGESVHGSATINKSAMQLVKYQVTTNNARLILMEMPLTQLLSYNRFIQGDEDFRIDSLLRDFHTNISPDLLTGLLVWLKEYNRTTEEKVWLMGMDIDIRQMNSAMWLFDYLYTLNQQWPHPVFKSLCAQLVKSDRSFENMSRLLESDSDVERILGEKEYEILKYSLEMNARISSRTNRRRQIRDSMMFENSKFLIKLLAPGTTKAVFYSHLGHSNYKTQVSDYSTPSFGAYMKDEYGNDYSTIGIFVGRGRIRVMQRDSMQATHLQAPPPNSIEYLLNEHPTPYLYLPAVPGPIKMREVGAFYTPVQFNAVSLPSRMDALIFIRDSDPVEKSREKNDPAYVHTFSMRKFIRNFERNKTLSEQ